MLTEQKYCQTSTIRHTKSQNLIASRLVLQLSLTNPLKPYVKVKNEDVVGAVPTGNASTTSEWSTILLPTMVPYIRGLTVSLLTHWSYCAKPSRHPQGQAVQCIVRKSGGCFTNVLRALQNNLAKICNARNHIYVENFKLKLCTCAQNMSSGMR